MKQMIQGLGNCNVHSLIWAEHPSLVAEKTSCRVNCCNKFTQQEVFSAAKSLGKDVSPGKDGIGVGFYLHYSDFLGPLLTRAVNLIFSSGSMPAEWTEGIIYMIPKSDA